MCGLYINFTPCLLAINEDLVHNVMVKHFDHFVDRGGFEHGAKEDEFLDGLLIEMKGQRWKTMRTALAPAFSPVKIRHLYKLMGHSIDMLIDNINECLQDSLPISKLMKKFMTNVIMHCVYGIDTNKCPEKAMEIMHKAETSVPYVNENRLLLNKLFPQMFTLFGMRISVPAMDYFKNLSEETLRVRKESSDERGDFIDILLETLQKNQNIITEDIVISQLMEFLLAGRETSSVSLAFTMYLLAKHQDIQNSVREHIKNIEKENGEYTYDIIMTNKVLEAVFLESIRLYPIAPLLGRVCTKAYKVPETNIIIPEGMPVFIPVWSIHRDESYWENPNDFNPFRYTKNDSLRKLCLHHFTFGQGPRACIGKRIAMVQTKLLLAKLLSRYRLEVPPDYELKLSTSPIVLKPKSEIYLKITPI